MGLWTENKKKLLEAVLYLENNPVSCMELEEILDIDDFDLQTLIEDLKKTLEERDSALTIDFVEDKVYLRPKEQFLEFLSQIYGEKDRRRFSKASLEVLSIIAWKQPITRNEVEAVRGVDSTNSIKNLLEDGYIKVVGKKDTLGKPQTFGTTEKFLKYFGINSIEELPRIEDLKEIYS